MSKNESDRQDERAPEAPPREADELETAAAEVLTRLSDDIAAARLYLRECRHEALAAYLERNGPRPECPDGYLMDARERMVPARLVSEIDRLEDDVVWEIASAAFEAHRMLVGLREAGFETVEAMLALVYERYGARLGGARGNIRLTSYDGRLRIELQRRDEITFGPSLAAAQSIIADCLEDWTKGARSDELRILVEDAFKVGQGGQIRKEAVLRLTKLEIDDERFREAQAAIVESIRIANVKPYLRIYARESSQEGTPWTAITLNCTAPALPDLDHESLLGHPVPVHVPPRFEPRPPPGEAPEEMTDEGA